MDNKGYTEQFDNLSEVEKENLLEFKKKLKC